MSAFGPEWRFTHSWVVSRVTRWSPESRCVEPPNSNTHLKPLVYHDVLLSIAEPFLEAQADEVGDGPGALRQAMADPGVLAIGRWTLGHVDFGAFGWDGATGGAV